MTESTKTTAVLITLAGLFFALAIGFVVRAWTREPEVPVIVMVDRKFVDTSPVRMNYAALLAADEDTSDFSCYACHRRDEKIELEFDELGKIIFEEHDYITFNHGLAYENNYCFHCHDHEQLDQLRTPFRTLSFEESNLLCASCHGSVYKDWERGVHGRTSGYWNLAMGEQARLDCTQCHDPHNPGFPSLEPAPAPNSLHNRIIIQESHYDE